jgi:hypothetical protein
MDKWDIINYIIIGFTMFIVLVTALRRKEGFTGNIDTIKDKIKSSSQYEQWVENGMSGPFIVIGPSGSTGNMDPSINPLIYSPPSESTTTTSYDYDHTTQQDNTIVFYGQNNSTATVSNNLGQLQISVNYGNGNTEIYNYSQVYNDQIIFISSGSNKAVLIKTENSMTLTIYANGNTFVFYTDINKNRNQLAGYLNDYYYSQDEPISSQPTTINSNMYSNYLPPGIPRSSIPSGKEDLYILKSEVVPPVCPVCPPTIIVKGTGKNGKNGNDTDTPPCPACERCPEPIVDCKKVVKYKTNEGGSYGDYASFDQEPVQKVFNQFEEKAKLFDKGKNYKPESTDSGPVPLLNSFSAFGI